MKKSFWFFVILGFMLVLSISLLDDDNNPIRDDNSNEYEEYYHKGSMGQAGTPENDSSDDKIKIVIDPGHGGKDPGATGVSGSYEKTFNLDVALKVFQLFENDTEIDVYLTGEDDRFLSSETRERPDFANSINADLYISLHANTFSDPTVSGTETFYYNDHSKALADTIHPHVVQATGFPDRGVKKEDYFVLEETDMPAILIEIGYISNEQDELVMLTENFQQAVAESIVEGVKEYAAKHL